MNKILLIIQREYLSRVKKKSFILMTLLTPILIAAFYGLIIYFSIEGASKSFDRVAVVSENTNFSSKLASDDNISITYLNESLDKAKAELKNDTYDYILHIPNFPLEKPSGIELFGNKQAGLALNKRVSDKIEDLIRNQKLEESGISQSELDKLNTNVEIANKKIAETGEEENSSAGASTLIAFAAGILMFMFIMIYGIQVMRGVIEEKTNRIIEVMISSVKPFQLMMGKIVGIALVGLTQFILWIVLTAAISTATVSLFVDKEDLQKSVVAAQTQGPGTVNLPADAVTANAAEDISNPIADMQKSLEGLNITKIVLLFLFYFLAGYLFYSALYAAIGSAVDNETETQQFMMPVMMPLFLGYALSLSVVANDPYGDIAFWLSMIPFTSPIAMVVHLPYGVPDWQLALSIFLLVLGFLGTVWLASKIYRVGILMYGKKVSFKEMIKWFTYKN